MRDEYDFRDARRGLFYRRGHRVRMPSSRYDPPPPTLPLTPWRAAILAIAYVASIVAAVEVDRMTCGDGLAMSASMVVFGFTIGFIAHRWTRSPWRGRQ